MKMQSEKLDEVIEKIESSTTRERGLIFLSCLAVVYLLWDFVLFTPLLAEKKSLNNELIGQQTKIETLQKEEKMLITSLKNDPNRELQSLINSMKKKKDDLETTLESLSGGLVRVETLSLILQEVLTKTDDLELESLKTLPVEALDILGDSTNKTTVARTNSQQESKEDNTINTGVYKHGVSLTVKGTYFQLIDYLHKLENMPSKFYWEELRYEQDQYPNGFFHLKVYTLTRNEGYSGV